MSLINTTTATPAGLALGKIAANAQKTFNDLLNDLQGTLSSVWKNPAATAADIIALMGTDAVNNFSASAATAAFLTQFSSLTFSAAAHTANLAKIAAIEAIAGTFTPNADGTVTVTPATSAPVPAPTAG